jgi:hypothetical protein
MALIVRNTFLDFAVEESSFAGERRCHSLPRKWKQAPPRSSSDDRGSPVSPDASTRASLRSDFSFYSDEDLCTSSADVLPEADVCAACGWCLGSELAKISCYLTKSPCEPEFRIPEFRASFTDHVASDDDTSASIVDKDTSACSDAFEIQDVESDGCTRAEFVVDAEVDRPKLNASMEARPSLIQLGNMVEPAPSDPRMDAVANAVQSALASCGRAQHVGTQHRVNIRGGHGGTSSVLISAEVENGARAFSSSYDVVRIAKNELEAAVARIKTLKLLSSRLQKEDFGPVVDSFRA